MRWIGKRAFASYQAELERRCLAPATRERYSRIVCAFLRDTRKPTARISRQDVRSWLAASATRGLCSGRGDLGVLRDFFGLLYELGRVSQDPTEGLAKPNRPPLRAQLVLGPDAVRTLLAEAAREPKSRRGAPYGRALALRNRACFELLYGLGLRASEVGAARVTDLDLIEGSLLCRAAKRGQDRCLPLPPASLPHLAAYLREGRALLLHRDGGDAGRLLLNQAGCPLDGNGILRLVGSVAQRAGIHATPHAFRRSIATHLVRAGVSVPAVQKLLGHASLAVTARYVLVDMEDLHRAVAALELDERFRRKG